MKFLKSRLISFRHAIIGWQHVVKTQENAWIHLVATILVIILAVWLKISLYGWIGLLLVIGIVWISEFLNTALEVIVDLASPERHPLAKVGKDVGAAAVLISASIAVIIGLLILGPPLLKKIAILF